MSAVGWRSVPGAPCQTPAVRLAPPVIAGVAALTACGGVLAGCGDDGPAGTAKFCGEVQEQSTALLTAPTTIGEIAPYLDLYKRLERDAPLAIQPHWQALVLNIETASTVDPTDQASVQRSLARAYQTEESALAVHDFLLASCNVDLGPVATIVAHGPVAPTGTVPATSAG